MMLRAGLADAAIVAGTGNWWRHIQWLLPIIPRSPEATRVYAMSALILQSGTLFICDTHMLVDPTAEQICEITLLAADTVHDFGIMPKAALVSHSSFGASDTDSARKMRRARFLIRERAPDLEIDGEMHADAALVEAIRDALCPTAFSPALPTCRSCPTLMPQYLFQPAKGRGRWPPGRANSARPLQAYPRPRPERHRPRHHQPQRAGGAGNAWCAR